MDSIYGDKRPEMEAVMQLISGEIDGLRKELTEKYGSDPVEHCLSRIKSEESMREKCDRKGLPQTEKSALEDIHDAIGLRVVCAFVSDVYKVRDHLAGMDECEVVEEKDYIKHAKPNGYRSYHMILKVRGYYAEVQIRTISMDTWAALEHNIKYKKNIGGNKELIEQELKRCADELAATDMSMQTLRDMIYESK
ncbi:MAG: GTP pyrophosphokinase family protein [Anaerovoracaceae bacterium]